MCVRLSLDLANGDRVFGRLRGRRSNVLALFAQAKETQEGSPGRAGALGGGAPHVVGVRVGGATQTPTPY